MVNIENKRQNNVIQMCILYWNNNEKRIINAKNKNKTIDWVDCYVYLYFMVNLLFTIQNIYWQTNGSSWVRTLSFIRIQFRWNYFTLSFKNNQWEFLIIRTFWCNKLKPPYKSGKSLWLGIIIVSYNIFFS